MSTLSSRFVADFGPHRGRMGGGFHHPGLILFGLLLLAGVITLIVLLARGNRITGPMSGNVPAGPVSPASSAEAILSERFARGEVSVEDFVTARAALRGEWTPGRSPTTTPVAPTPMPPVPPAPPD